MADFRRWLEDLAAGGSEPPPEPAGYPAEPGRPSVDLATLAGAFTALRHEVNLQTKATRAQSEQFAQALEALKVPAAADGNAARPLVKVVAEVYDALTRAAHEIEQLQQRPADAPAAPPSLWARLFRRPATVPPADGGGLADRLKAAATGLRMSERRVERLMREAGLEPVECVGRPFDPEAMEAVEAVEGGGQPPGTVVEELRRGYRWRGRVFRYAQVRVAK